MAHEPAIGYSYNTLSAAAVQKRAYMNSDIRIRDFTTDTEDFHYRSPIKFGGVILDRVTILNVRCIVETRAGKYAHGFGSMPLGNVWAFPSKLLSYEQTLGAMKAVAERVKAIATGYREFGHPIDIAHHLEPAYLSAAVEVTKVLDLPEPIPPLCTLVAASPFDAALHDAFGKLHGLNCFSTYGPDFMAHDLGHYLGDEFKGESLSQYVEVKAKPRMPLYHLVGARPSNARRSCEADRRWPARDARRVDRLQWPHPFENQTERRRPRLGCRACTRRQCRG